MWRSPTITEGGSGDEYGTRADHARRDPADRVPRPAGYLSVSARASDGLSQTRISEIVRGRRSITTDTALRLSKALGVDDRFWINIQTDYDLEVARDLHADDLARVIELVAS